MKSAFPTFGWFLHILGELTRLARAGCALVVPRPEAGQGVRCGLVEVGRRRVGLDPGRQSGHCRSRDQVPSASAAATASMTAPARPDRAGQASRIPSSPPSTVTPGDNLVHSNPGETLVGRCLV
jgi:hypothetical protein